jgi:hypothetical protein
MPKISTSARNWLAKHHKWLPYTGAFIVFCTFIVKEGLGDYWRHLGEQIELAQYMYSLKSEMSRHGMILNRMDERSNSAGNNSKNVDDIDRARSNVKSSEADIEATIANVRLLAERMPHERDIQKKMMNFEENFGKAKTEEIAIDVAQSLHDENGTPEADHNSWTYTSDILKSVTFDELSYDPAIKRFHQLLESLGALSWDLYDFNDEVLKRALRVKKHNELLSEIAWWCSAILVLLAFTVAVLSRKYGEEDLEFENAAGQLETVRKEKTPSQNSPHNTADNS